MPDFKPLEEKYRKSSGTAVSIGLTDFLTNRGYLTLFGGKTADRALLSTIAFFSSEGNEVTLGTQNQPIDIDFDIVTQVPLIIQGRGFVTVPLWHFNNTGGTSDTTTTLNVLLRKWDGSSETEIVSENATATALGVLNNEGVGKVWTVDFDIPRTSFKKDETIRITITTTAPGVTKEIGLIHDPKGREAPTKNSGGSVTFIQPDSTILQGLIPTVLDI